MSPVYEPRQRYGERITNLWGSNAQKPHVFDALAQTSVSQSSILNAPKSDLTLLEKRWIDFFTYIGVSPEVIARSLNNVRDVEAIEARQSSKASKNAVLEMRIERKNSVQSPPPYPYKDDVREADDPTLATNRERAALYDIGVDTGMKWDEWRTEDVMYLEYVMSRYGGEGLNSDLFVYYTLFTPMNVRTLPRLLNERKDKVGTYSSPVPCPYVFSYGDYVSSGLSRRFTAFNGEYLYSPTLRGENEEVFDALRRTENVEHICVNVDKLSTVSGHTVTHQSLALSLLWNGASKSTIENTLASSFEITEHSAYSTLIDALKTRKNGEPTAPKHALHYVPTSKVPALSYYPNIYYKPETTFTGFDDKEYTLNPWSTVTAKFIGVPLQERLYLAWLAENYPERAVARYVALYTPSKDFNGFARGVAIGDYLDKAKRAKGTVVKEVPCPFEVPMEAVYDAGTESVLYYEHLNVKNGAVVDIGWDASQVFISEADFSASLEQSAKPEKAVQEELSFEEEPEPAVAGEQPAVEEASVEDTSDEFMDSMAKLVGSGNTTKVGDTEGCATDTAEEAQVSATKESEAYQAPSTTEKKTVPVAHALPECAPQYKPLPGDSKLAIDFALPGVDEAIDHGALNRAQQEALNIARRTPFAPLAPAPKHSGHTLGDVAVKTSQAVSGVMRRIIAANEEAVTNAPLSVIAALLNIPPLAVVTILTREHGWGSSIEGLAALVNVHPDTMFSVFAKQFDSNAPFSSVPVIFGISVDEALRTLIGNNAGLDLKDIPLSLIAEALGKTQDAIIADSIGLGSLL